MESYNKDTELKPKKIHAVLEQIKCTRTTVKALSLISWRGEPPRLDLRRWYLDGERATPCKGITLTDEEAEEFATAIIEYLRKKRETAQQIENEREV